MNFKNTLLIFCVFSVTVLAADTDERKTLTLEQAIIRVLENHPKLKVADYKAQAMAARMRQALLAPADSLDFNLEDFAGTGNAAGVRGLEATLSLSRTLELGNKALMRGEVVQGETALLVNQKDIERLDILAETTRRFIHIAVDQERLRMTEEAIDLIRLTEATVEERIRAGKTPIAERHRVVIDLTNYEVELDHRKHELENSLIRLTTLWNERYSDFDRVEGDIFNLGMMQNFDDLAILLDRNPDLIRYTRTEDLAMARIRLAESKGKPDIGLSAGIRYLGEGDDIAFMLRASIPLGTKSRAQHGIREAEALSRIEPLNLQQRRMELYATLFEIYQEMKHARDAYEALVEKIIPAAEQMLSAYEEGYQAGRYSLLELIQVQQTLRDARSQSIEMAANYHDYRLEIDRLTGAQIDKR